MCSTGMDVGGVPGQVAQQPGALPGGGPPRGRPPVLAFANGCHLGSFFGSQEPGSLAFLAAQLT